MNESELVARGVVDRLAAAGFTAYFAGGCVRDRLRGEEPSDYDIATDALPEDVVALYPRARLVGAHFGVCIVHEGGHFIEVATFRNDGSYRDGRRPETVTFSSPDEDAHRRDFTINGMFYDPRADRIIDHVGGQADLDDGIVRAIGTAEHRFREDRLRMLRAVRFAARFGFEIEAATWRAIRNGAASLEGVSAERVRDELSKILVDANRVRGFDLLVESGLMAHAIPEILDLKGCEQPAEFHPEGDVFTHTRLMLELIEGSPSLPLVLSVLLHDIGKPDTFTHEEGDRIRFNGHDKLGAQMADAILRRLRYPNEVIDAVVGMVENHMVFKDVQHMRTAKLKRFMARDHYREELELHRLDCLASWGGLDNHEFLLEKEEQFATEPIIPPPLLRGRDLLERGWRPGPALGGMLRRIQDLQLEGELATREDALEWLEENAPKP